MSKIIVAAKWMICFVFLVISFCEVSGAEIFMITKKNRGIFGYSSVDYQEFPGLGGALTCTDPGWSGCRAGMVVNDPDFDQEEVVFKLVDDAEIEILNGSRSGQLIKLIQIAGETQTRRYVVSWTATNATRRPTETVGNGQEYTISVDVTFVN